MRLRLPVSVVCLLLATGFAMATTNPPTGEAEGEYVYTNADLEPLPSGSDAYFIDPFDGLGWGFVSDVLQMSYSRLDADRRHWLAVRVTEAHLREFERDAYDTFDLRRRPRYRPYWHIPTINGIPAPFFYSNRRHDRHRAEPYPWLTVKNSAALPISINGRRWPSPVRQLFPELTSRPSIEPVEQTAAEHRPRSADLDSSARGDRDGRELSARPAVYRPRSAPGSRRPGEESAGSRSIAPVSQQVGQPRRPTPRRDAVQPRPIRTGSQRGNVTRPVPGSPTRAGRGRR